MSIVIFDDYTLMYDNDVIILPVFVRFDLATIVLLITPLK